MSRRRFANLSLDDDEDDYYDGYDEEEEEQGYYEDEAAHEPDDERLAGAPNDVPAGDNADPVPEDVCAICLEAIPLEDLAFVKGCLHQYCAFCILQWAGCREVPWCPQCKAPFNYLYCHRLLDGSLSDEPVEESVCLLKRAQWFVDHVKVQTKGKAVSAEMASAGETPAEWGAEEDYLYDEEDEEEQIEAYYFSSASGRARIVLGNRRGGENGYMRAGRMFARPALPAVPTPNSGAKQKAAANKARAAAATPANTVGASSSRGGGGGTGSGSGGAGPSGSSAEQQQQQQQAKAGRRAQRKAKRAAADGLEAVFA